MADDLDAWGAPEAAAVAQAAPATPTPQPERPEQSERPEAVIDPKESADRAFCLKQLDRVIGRARVDPALRPYVVPMLSAGVIWSRTLVGARGDLPDGRFIEIDGGEVRFGNIKFVGTRRTPL